MKQSFNRKHNSKLLSGKVTLDAVSVDIFRKKCFNKIGRKFKEQKEDVFKLRLQQLNLLIRFKPGANKASRGLALNFDIWTNLIVGTVDNDKNLIEILFKELSKSQSHLSAIYNFANIFGHDYLKVMPEAMQTQFRTSSKEIERQLAQIKVSDAAKLYNERDYYSCEEIKQPAFITYVDSEAGLNEMIAHFETNKIDLIGLDCEWTPVLVKELAQFLNTLKKASILQVATRSRVFVIEMRHLFEGLEDKLLVDKFLDAVFFSKSIVKLGYGFEQDMSMLKNSFPAHLDKFNSVNVYELDKLVTEFEKKWPLTTTTASGQFGRGLSRLTGRCFGKPLNKIECCSDWSSKPLRPTQLRYAALDAFVLIKLHDHIHERCKSLNVTFKYKNLVFN